MTENLNYAFVRVGQCLGREEKLDKEKGIVEWKSTEMGQVSMAACPFGSQSLYSLKQVLLFTALYLADHLYRYVSNVVLG